MKRRFDGMEEDEWMSVSHKRRVSFLEESEVKSVDFCFLCEEQAYSMAYLLSLGLSP